MKRNLLLCSAVALLAWGCKDGGTTPSVATSVAVSPGSVTFDAVGATRVVHAAVADQDGDPMPGAALSWSSSSAAVTVAGAGGDSAIVTAAGNGAATVTATSGSASGTASAQVTQVATNMQKAGGDAQTGVVGTALPVAIQARVRDRLNAPVAGVTVSFGVIGGGTVSSPTAVTGADGIASVTWTLGTSVGVVQQVTASAAGMDPLPFLATVVAGAPASAIKAAGDNQTAGRGTALSVAPRVVVRDAFSNPVAGVSVQFSVSGGGGSVTGATQTTDATGSATVGGWTLGPASGANTLTATFPGTAVAAVVFAATGATPGTMAIAGGNNQAVMAGALVGTAPSVLVRDGGGNPLAGQTVSFTVTAGDGTVGNATATTNASGVASAGSWRMGATGGLNTLTATVDGLTAAPVVFRGVGCFGGGAGYALTLCFTTPMTASQRTVFQNAATRWGSVITGDVPDVTGTVPAGTCGSGTPSLNLTFDDLVIFAGIESIDGPGGILGSAGPCLIRTVGSLPILGVMRFDVADMANLEANGNFGSVILHEMGHVLGIGTLWSTFGLLQNPSSAGSPLDTYFSGTNAIAGFNSIGGNTYSAGQKVPVENGGGAGTMNGHWRESVLANELMTGYLTGSTQPMSLVTVRSLTDLGYAVDVTAADAFTLSLALRAEGPTTGIKLHNDLYTGPLYAMDRQGRLTRLRN